MTSSDKSQASKPQMPINSYFLESGPTTVRVVVGTDKVTWVLPEDLLCDKIDFFRAAFKTGFCEGTEKVINMEEDDPASFGRVVDWIFGKEFMCDFRLHRSDTDVAIKVDIAHQLDYCKLYVLAHKIGLYDYATRLVNRFEHCQSIDEDGNAGPFPSPEVVTYVYQNTAEGSPLRKVVTMHTLAYFLNGKNDSKLYAAALAANAEFAEDACDALRVHIQRQNKQACNIWNCLFHRSEIIPF